MCPDEAVSDGESCGHSVELLNTQLAAASGVFEWMADLSRNVAGSGLKDLALDGLSPASAVAVAGDGFSAPLQDMPGQSLLEVAAVVEARGERSSTVMLNAVWRDIDLYQWQIVPLDPAETDRRPAAFHGAATPGPRPGCPVAWAEIRRDPGGLIHGSPRSGTLAQHSVTTRNLKGAS